MGNCRNVNPGSQQIHGDTNAGVAFVFETLDQLADLIALAGDLLYRGLIKVWVDRTHGLIEQALNHIGVGVSGAENQRFFIAGRVYLFSQLFADYTVKIFGDYFTVEGVDVEIQLVFQLAGIDFPCFCIHGADGVACLKVNTVFAELGLIANRGFVVNQPVFRHRFPVGVNINRVTKNLAGVFCRGGGQADLYGVKIVEHPTVAGEILGVIANRDHGVLRR